MGQSRAGARDIQRAAASVTRPSSVASARNAPSRSDTGPAHGGGAPLPPVGSEQVPSRGRVGDPGSFPAMLDVNSQAPDFEAPDQHGNVVRLSDQRGNWVVLWWYPKASTAG